MAKRVDDKKRSAKPFLSSSRTAPPATRRISVSEQILDDIQRKITTSSALNGGFDTLLHKVDRIEQNQGQISTTTDQLVSTTTKIHDAIYDPTDGIFAKLSETRLEHATHLSEVEQKIVELSEWKKHREKVDDKETDVSVVAGEKITSLEHRVEQLVKSRNTAWGVVKWIGVGLGGGVVGLLFKWVEGRFFNF